MTYEQWRDSAIDAKYEAEDKLEEIENEEYDEAKAEILNIVRDELKILGKKLTDFEYVEDLQEVLDFELTYDEAKILGEILW